MEHPLRYDHYKVLGVPRDADARLIKRAYRDRVKQWHPDRNGAPNASEVFHALHEAYSTLIDSDLRTAYDERLRFYRTAAQPKEPDRGTHNTHVRRDGTGDPPPTSMDRAAFKGLHLTGLAFGVLMVLGICFGCTFLGWPMYVLFFTLPGLAVIPDSVAGLRDQRK